LSSTGCAPIVVLEILGGEGESLQYLVRFAPEFIVTDTTCYDPSVS
jgi:hypothetical protein